MTLPNENPPTSSGSHRIRLFIGCLTVLAVVGASVIATCWPEDSYRWATPPIHITESGQIRSGQMRTLWESPTETTIRAMAVGQGSLTAIECDPGEACTVRNRDAATGEVRWESDVLTKPKRIHGLNNSFLVYDATGDSVLLSRDGAVLQQFASGDVLGFSSTIVVVKAMNLAKTPSSDELPDEWFHVGFWAADGTQAWRMPGVEPSVMKLYGSGDVVMPGGLDRPLWYTDPQTHFLVEEFHQVSVHRIDTGEKVSSRTRNDDERIVALSGDELIFAVGESIAEPRQLHGYHVSNLTWPIWVYAADTPITVIQPNREHITVATTDGSSVVLSASSGQLVMRRTEGIALTRTSGDWTLLHTCVPTDVPDDLAGWCPRSTSATELIYANDVTNPTWRGDTLIFAHAGPHGGLVLGLADETAAQTRIVQIRAGEPPTELGFIPRLPLVTVDGTQDFNVECATGDGQSIYCYTTREASPIIALRAS